MPVHLLGAFEEFVPLHMAVDADEKLPDLRHGKCPFPFLIAQSRILLSNGFAALPSCISATAQGTVI